MFDLNVTYLGIVKLGLNTYKLCVCRAVALGGSYSLVVSP